MSASRTLYQCPVKRLTADRAEPGPGFEVPDGAVVEISRLPGNAASAYYSTTSAEAAKAGGPRDEITATGLPRRVTVRNLADIFIYSGTIGEGLQLTVLQS